jgi:hypothetical protein
MSGLAGPGGGSMDPRPRDEARFDEELRRAARSLIKEQLPPNVLDPALAGSRALPGRVTTRRALPGFAGAAAAVVVLLIATAVALAPGAPHASVGTPPATESLGMQLSPAPSVLPVFRATSSILMDLGVLDYRCNDGAVIESPKPGPDAIVKEAAVCTAPDSAGPLTAAVIIGEATGGRVVEILVKADIVGDETPAALQAVAETVGTAASVVAYEKANGAFIKAWVLEKLPTVSKNESVVLQARGYAMRIFRSATGSFLLSMGPF